MNHYHCSHSDMGAGACERRRIRALCSEIRDAVTVTVTEDEPGFVSLVIRLRDTELLHRFTFSFDNWQSILNAAKKGT